MKQPRKKWIPDQLETQTYMKSSVNLVYKMKHLNKQKNLLYPFLFFVFFVGGRTNTGTLSSTALATLALSENAI